MTDSGTPRREFLFAAAAAATSFAFGPRVLLPRPAAIDLIIRGATVIDGTGRPGFITDVAVTGKRIAAIGRNMKSSAREEIDGKGLALAPGFVDVHSHADGTLFDDPHAESIIRQGVTTVVVGQDGSSRAPHVPREAEGDGDAAALATMADVFRSLDQLAPAINVASMVGLGTIRGAVVGSADRPATAQEMKRMRALVDRALSDGACGASTGLEYTPGAFAPRDELIELSRPLATARRGVRLPYATHMRNEDDQLIEAVDEAIAVARGARCALQISHLKTQGPRNWKKLGEVFAHIEQARTAGIDVQFDRYPYVAYQTGLSNLFPVWAKDGGTEPFLKRLTDPATAERVHTESVAKVDLIAGWDNVMISGVVNEADRHAEGQRLGSLAQAMGQDPYALAVAMLQRNRGDVGMVGFAMSEENLERILAHPLGMVCSDGGAFAVDGKARRGHPHPRGLGTFPRVLSRYVRDRHALTLEQAVHKMTAQPASRVGLVNRGRIAVGMAADLVLFDPATIEDKATFADPFQYPVGIQLVMVNGAVALRDGQRGAVLAGGALRAGNRA